MNNIKTLYKFFNLSIKSLMVSDIVTMVVIYERLLVILLISFVCLTFIFQGLVDFILFQKLFIIIIGLHSYHGLSLICDDYVKNIYINSFYKSCFFILWLSLFFI